MTLSPREEPTAPTEFIVHSTDGLTLVLQRVKDGYINATAICKACGKEFSDYNRLETTEAFLHALARSLGIPRDLARDQLVQRIMTGPNDQRGTWVHPKVAVHVGQWASPEFAVLVSDWVTDWMHGKYVTTPKPTDNPFELIIQQAQAALELQRAQIMLAGQQQQLTYRQGKVEERQDEVEDRVEHVENRLDYFVGGSGHYTIKAFGRKNGVKNLSNSTAKGLGLKATKICEQKGLDIGKAPDESFGQVNTYPEDVLLRLFVEEGLIDFN